MKIDKEARVQGFTFEECLAEFPGEFPALRASLENQRPAHSTKLEWLYDSPDGKRRVEHNYTQIFRKVCNGDAKAALSVLLSQIEEALLSGERELDISGSEPRGIMGGAKFFGDDRARLRPLQTPVLLNGGGVSEWLSEVGAEFLYTTGTPSCETCGKPK